MRVGKITAGSDSAIELLNNMFGGKRKNGSTSNYQYEDTASKAVSTIKDALNQQKATVSNISEYTKLKKSFSKLSDSGKKELSEILSKAAGKIKKGTLDSEAMAKSASKDLKKSLEAQGVDLENALDSLNSLYSSTKAKIFDSKGALR